MLGQVAGPTGARALVRTELDMASEVMRSVSWDSQDEERWECEQGEVRQAESRDSISR
jgi:hypothetical protein